MKLERCPETPKWSHLSAQGCGSAPCSSVPEFRKKSKFLFDNALTLVYLGGESSAIFSELFQRKRIPFFFFSPKGV
jgi:hypothetical protein